MLYQNGNPEKRWLVHWKGRPDSENSYLPEQNINTGGMKNSLWLEYEAKRKERQSQLSNRLLYINNKLIVAKRQRKHAEVRVLIITPDMVNETQFYVFQKAVRETFEHPIIVTAGNSRPQECIKHIPLDFTFRSPGECLNALFPSRFDLVLVCDSKDNNPQDPKDQARNKAFIHGVLSFIHELAPQYFAIKVPKCQSTLVHKYLHSKFCKGNVWTNFVICKDIHDVKGAKQMLKSAKYNKNMISTDLALHNFESI